MRGTEKMQEYITEKLFDLFEKSLFRDLNQWDNPLLESIFGEKIALLPTEAYYLLVSIEEKFNIKFAKEVVINGTFNYVGDIVMEIEDCLNKKVS